MRSITVGLILSAWTVPSLAQTPRQFDLLCEGQSWSGPIVEEGRQAEWNPRLRIDLEQRKFCWNECDSVLPLERIEDEFIVLNHDDEDIAPQQIERRSGRLTNDMVVGSYRIRQEAQCRVAPFSGFPAKLF